MARSSQGFSYRVEVTAPNQPPEGATFEIVDAAVARAGYLAEIRLLHDARLGVLAALARDPDEPVLHTLLATLFTQTGLPRQVAAAFDEAQSLMTRGTK
jgi:hypothetical protein